MKLHNLISGLAVTALMGATLASCSTDMEPVGGNKANGIGLAKAPKALAYAGNEKWDPFKQGGSSKGIRRAGATLTSEQCQTTLIDWDHEQQIVEEYLPEKNGNLREGMDTDFLFYADEDISLEFYPVYSQTSQTHNLGVFYYDEEGNYYETMVWENITSWNLTNTEWKWDEERGSYSVTTTKGVRLNIPAGYTFGFFWEGLTDNSTQTRCYSDASKNAPTTVTDGNGNVIPGEETRQTRAVTFVLDGKTYLGIEDWTDFDYQDFVFTCDKELKTVDASDFVPGQKPENPDPETPENPGPGDKGDDNGDDNNGDDNGGDNGDNNDGPVVTPERPAASGEVEVNLSLDEKEDDDIISSHLSIHVRTATNVKIFIPVPSRYYCEADDMAIVMQHEDNHMAHGGPREFTWTLKDSNLQVSLFVQYAADGIHVWTEGITQEVIDWCYEKCQDGITFELWNYFNDPDGFPLLSKEELRGYLDQATIDFIPKTPEYYINAFADPNGKYDAETNPNGDDFHVTPEWANQFDAPYEGTHHNNSDVNDIYKKNTPPPAPVY